MTAATIAPEGAAEDDVAVDPVEAPAAGEQPATPEPVPADEPEIVQPAEVDDGEPGQEIVVHAGAGALSFLPGQRDLDERQTAALVSIGIDYVNDPAILPHVRPFFHMCQVRGLDAFAREAYLIGRGWGSDRKYTFQISIDGFMKLAEATGRFVRIKSILWTGRDDDERSWRETVDEDGEVVMKRVWWNHWPDNEERGYPGAARVVIEHIDPLGNVVRSAHNADWAMYAPWVEEKVWSDAANRKVAVNGPDGKPIMKLTSMWEKGAPHMLAKCALALCVRRTFGGATAGVFIHEEMHQADAKERTRLAHAPAEQRAEAMATIRATAEALRGDGRTIGRADGIDSVMSTPSVPDLTIDGEVDEDPSRAPVRLGNLLNQAQAKAAAEQNADLEAKAAASAAAAAEAAAAPVEVDPHGPDGDPEQRRAWLLEELDLMGDALGASRTQLLNRWVKKSKKNPEEATAAELLRFVVPMRESVISVIREEPDGGPQRAQAYARVRPEFCGPNEWLLGLDLAADRK
jgi:hypothetical protein